MALNNWVSKWAAVASRMGAFDIEAYHFHFIDVEFLEDYIVEEVCDNCSGNCTGCSPLDPFCKHHEVVKSFIQCVIAGDMAMHNFPLYREFVGKEDK